MPPSIPSSADRDDDRKSEAGSDSVTNAQDVNLELDRVLQAPEFTASNRMTGFMRFVVGETLQGRSGRIKQYTLAVHVFERGERFDQQNDPIVRVTAGKIRRALQRYYLQEGSENPIQIEIPKGTYVPRFLVRREKASDSVKPRSRPEQAPTVAVMPFQNRTGDDSQQFLASGFAEDLSTDLSHFRSVCVVAYYTTQQYDDSQHDVCRLGKEFGADYLVTGSLRRTELELRVNVQLHDAQSGVQVWAERFCRDHGPDDLFKIQDEILQSVTAQLAGTYSEISRLRAESARRKDHASLSGYEAVLRACYYDKTMTPDDFRDALGALRAAVKTDPGYTSAWARLAIVELDGVVFGFNPDDDAARRGREYAERAIALDANNQDAQFAMAWASLIDSDPRGAIKAAWRMVELNPGDAAMVGTGGWFLALAGERQRGLEIIQRSHHLNPHCPAWFHLIPFLDHLESGDYEAALREAQQVGLPDFFWDPLLKAAALGLLGYRDESAAMLRRVKRLRPDFEERASFYVGTLVLPRPLRERMFQGLAQGGLQVGPSA